MLNVSIKNGTMEFSAAKQAAPQIDITPPVSNTKEDEPVVVDQEEKLAVNNTEETKGE